MKKTAIICFVLTGILFISPQSHGQSITGPLTLGMTGTGAYSIVQRSNLLRYNNNRYIGHVLTEVRANILPDTTRESWGSTNPFFKGNFFVMQNTLRDMQQAVQAVDKIVPVSFEVLENGAIIIEDDRGFPRMRDFPVFPDEPVMQGSRWTAPGSYAADPFNTDHALIIPFIAEYEYRGIEVYRDMRVHRIAASYASRYRKELPEENENLDPVLQRFIESQQQGSDRNAIPREHDINSVQGSHRVDILIRVEDGLLLFMQDNLNVTYTMEDGSTVRFQGFILTYGQPIVPMDRGEVVASLEEITALDFQDLSFDIEPILEGIRLTIRDIRFVPDSAEFLPEERYRLDLIAQALMQIPDRTFLVEGHTASIGNPQGEMTLSIERARRMADELVRRGISADRFLYNGWGGTRPIADNSSEAGRSQNRRVEITILE